MAQRTCNHPGCDRPHDARGYCRTHNSRIRTHGDSFGKRCVTCRRPLEEVFTVVRSQSYCNPRCRPLCSVEGCDGRVRKLSWCASHYSQFQQSGGVRPFTRRWAPSGTPCRQCGRESGLSLRSRVYCSAACQRLWLRWGGNRPTEVACALCADPIDLTVVASHGRRHPSQIRLCESCVKRKKFGITVGVLARRDGTDCSICGETVDMTLRRRDSVFCPSIDHRVPRARGGTDDPSNLALAHFWCNAVKSDREAFTI